MDSGGACAFQCLPPRGRLDNHFIRPTNVEESFLQPTSFQKQLPRNITMLFIPIFLRFLEHEKPETTPAKHPPSILHNHALLPTFLACCRNISCQCIYRHRISHTKLMSIVISLLKTNVCKCGHFYNHITGLTHHCSCKSSSLPPRLNFSNLIHPSFFLLLIPFSHSDSFCPTVRGQSREIFLHLKTKGLHQKGQRGRTLFARCC